MTVIERECVDYDVVIVGGGPAGLSAAIRLKQLNADLSVIVVEKGAETGSHILSGAVMDPCGLDELLPDWRDRGAPVSVEVTDDRFLFLTEKKAFSVPHRVLPSLMSNKGNFIISLGAACRWLAKEAETLGVEIFTGMAASEVVYGEGDRVHGVIAGEFGKNPDGSAGKNYEPGTEIRGRYTFFCEGASGSLSKNLIGKLALSDGRSPQKFGIGLKEVWEIAPSNHTKGAVVHTVGWPLDSATGGGSFLYHAEDHRVYIGFVVHLNYANPYIDPYEEFQRFKHHPAIAPVLEGGRRISYGARAITEGGWQSLPTAAFAGGALLGCAAGLVNVPRIKGVHNAIRSGILAAESAAKAIARGRKRDVLDDYDSELRDGAIGQDLKKVMNVKPLWERYGLYGGLALGGLDMWFNAMTGRSLFRTLPHRKTDAKATEPALKFKKIEYPKADGKLSFDRLASVALSSTNHKERQPCHLLLRDPSVPISINLPFFAEPAQRYCPAGVYEVLEQAPGQSRFQINSQNCVHCKTCDIKDPSQNIVWTTPEGGDGPNYVEM